MCGGEGRGGRFHPSLLHHTLHKRVGGGGVSANLVNLVELFWQSWGRSSLSLSLHPHLCVTDSSGGIYFVPPVN